MCELTVQAPWHHWLVHSNGSTQPLCAGLCSTKVIECWMAGFQNRLPHFCSSTLIYLDWEGFSGGSNFHVTGVSTPRGHWWEVRSRGSTNDAQRFLPQSFSRRGIHMGWCFHFDSTVTTHPEVPTEIPKCECRGEERNKKGVVYDVQYKDCGLFTTEKPSVSLEMCLSEHKNTVKKHTPTMKLQSSPVPTNANWAGRTPQGVLKFKKSSTGSPTHSQQQHSSNLNPILAIDTPWLYTTAWHTLMILTYIVIHLVSITLQTASNFHHIMVSSTYIESCACCSGSK